MNFATIARHELKMLGFLTVTNGSAIFISAFLPTNFVFFRKSILVTSVMYTMYRDETYFGAPLSIPIRTKLTSFLTNTTTFITVGCTLALILKMNGDQNPFESLKTAMESFKSPQSLPTSIMTYLLVLPAIRSILTFNGLIYNSFASIFTYLENNNQ